MSHPNIQMLDFKFHIPLGQQKYTYAIGSSTLVSVPLMQSTYCKANVVASPDTAVNTLHSLPLCLQFSRSVNDAFLPPIYNIVAHNPAEFVALHITGPVDLGKGEYRLDNDTPAQWEDAVNIIERAAVALDKNTKRPTLQLFSLAPTVLMFAAGLRFYRFWPVQLYNYAGGTYKKVLDIFPE